MRLAPIHLKFDGINRSSVLSRYIVTYSSILILPCLILGLFLFNRATTQIKNNVIAAQAYTAEQLSVSLSAEFSDLLPIVNQVIHNNDIFWPSLWQNDKYNRASLIWELSKYKKYSALLQDCILIYRNHDSVFTSSSQDTIDGFFNQFRIESEIEAKIMATTKAWDIFPSSIFDNRTKTEYQALLYVIPFSLEKVTSNDMVMIFVIPAELLDKWSQRFLGPQLYHLYLFDENKVPILSIGTYTNDATEQVETFQDSALDQQLLYIGKNAVTMFKLPVATNNLNMILETPLVTIVQQLVEFRKLFILNGTLIILLGMVLVIIFSYSNYSPLKKIMKAIKALSPEIATTGGSNEFKQLDNAITAAIAEHQNLETYINQQGKVYFTEILSELLAGSVQYDKIDQYFNVTTRLPGPYFCVLAIHLRDCKPDLNQNQLLTKILTPSLDPFCRSAVVEVPSYRCTAVLLSMEQDDFSTAQDLAEKIYSLINTEQPLYMGASCIHDQIGELNQCMIESYLSLDCAEKQNALAVQFFQNSPGTRLRLNLVPETAVHTLTQSLKNGSHAQCIDIFNNMMDTIDGVQNPIFAKIQYYGIANAVLRIIGDLDLEEITLNINFLELYQDPDKFRNKMNLILTDVCKQVSLNRDNDKDDPFREILAYINEHYLEYDMSLDKLASDFKISVSMISKIFKATVGTGFKEYLINKRLDMAKHLLCSTTMPIHHITTAVGYVNESHFIKMFKLSDGMTPAEYRKRYGYVA